MAVDIRHAGIIPAVNDGEQTRCYWRVIYSNVTGSLSPTKVRSFDDRALALRFMEGLPSTYILYGVRKPMVAILQRVILEIEQQMGVSD